ncbi:MFS transporter [Sphingobium sp. ZW T5_29]|uniref:MFS transporter n=1 Tax=Sphingobium sp. ZW T5_29 TaxID=3378077 RepID=UPI003852FA9C
MAIEGSGSSLVSPGFSRMRSTRRLAVLLFLAYASLIAVFQGILNVLLPLVVARLAPDAKVGTLAFLSTGAAIAAVIALFAGGAVSDRTRSRWGKRTPSLLIALLASIALMPLVGGATSLLQLTVLLPLLWFTLNYYQSVLLAALPDRIPAHELSFASAAIGLGAPVGIFAGINIATMAANIMTGYIFLAIPLTILTFVLIVLEPEDSSLEEPVKERQNFSWKSCYAQFGSFAHRNYSLAAISRALLFLCYFSVTGYIFYLLQDYVGQEQLPYQSINAGMSIFSSVMTAAWLLVTVLTGWLSGRLPRTVLIVATVSILAGVVTLLPALSNSWIMFLIFGLGTGIMFGSYFVLDLKLATLVLPDEKTAGRDFGILLAAGSAPGVVAPAVAGAIIAVSGYPALFLFGAGVAFIGGLCVAFIRLR